MGPGTAEVSVTRGCIVPVNEPSVVKVNPVTNAVMFVGLSPPAGSIPMISNSETPFEFEAVRQKIKHFSGHESGIS